MKNNHSCSILTYYCTQVYEALPSVFGGHVIFVNVPTRREEGTTRVHKNVGSAILSIEANTLLSVRGPPHTLNCFWHFYVLFLCGIGPITQKKITLKKKQEWTI